MVTAGCRVAKSRRSGALRMTKMEPLSQRHTELLQSFQLARAFHTLGDEVGTRALCEGQQRGDQRLHARALIDFADQGDVELDDVRRQPQHMAQAGEARAGIVHGDAYPLLLQCRQWFRRP